MTQTHEQPRLFAADAYRADDPAAIVRAYPFALLITTGEAGVHATSIPIAFERDDSDGTLIGHLARRNPHAGALAVGQPALAVFQGPHAYISSAWYHEKPEVPTWNYLAAHVRGALEPIDDDQGQVGVLRRMVEVAERGAEQPWTLKAAPDGRVDFLLPMIRSFRIRISRIEGITKLNQTHPASDRLNVIGHLLDRRQWGDGPIARLMAGLGGDAPATPLARGADPR